MFLKNHRKYFGKVSSEQTFKFRFSKLNSSNFFVFDLIETSNNESDFRPLEREAFGSSLTAMMKEYYQFNAIFNAMKNKIIFIPAESKALLITS